MAYRKYYETILKITLEQEKSLNTLGQHHNLKKYWSKIGSFDGLGTIKELVRLDISDTNISSFCNCSSQPNLKYFLCLNTPLYREFGKHLDLMSCVVFGDSLRVLNKVEIGKDVRKYASKIREQVLPYLLKNYKILETHPIKVINNNAKGQLITLDEVVDPSKMGVVKKSKEDQVKSEIEQKNLDIYSLLKSRIPNQDRIKDIFLKLTEGVVNARKVSRSKMEASGNPAKQHNKSPDAKHQPNRANSVETNILGNNAHRRDDRHVDSRNKDAKNKHQQKVETARQMSPAALKDQVKGSANKPSNTNKIVGNGRKEPPLNSSGSGRGDHSAPKHQKSNSVPKRLRNIPSSSSAKSPHQNDNQKGKNLSKANGSKLGKRDIDGKKTGRDHINRPLPGSANKISGLDKLRSPIRISRKREMVRRIEAELEDRRRRNAFGSVYFNEMIRTSIFNKNETEYNCYYSISSANEANDIYLHDSSDYGGYSSSGSGSYTE